MSKVYKITERNNIERRMRTPEGDSVTVLEHGWGIEYRNSEWKDASVKFVLVTYLEHRNKFLELLHEAGYIEEK